MRGEAAFLVAAERILELVDQTLVRVGARPLRPINARLPLLHEVVVRDQRAADGDAVAVAALDCSGDDGCGLEATRADDRHRYGFLDRAAIAEVDALDAVPARPPPEPARHRGHRSEEHTS